MIRNYAARAVLGSILSCLLCGQGLAQRYLPSQEVQAEALKSMYPYGTGSECQTSVITTYDTRGYWVPASIEVCEHGMRDVTAGASAPSQGQRLFFIDGLAIIGSVYSLTRGFPNTPYELSKPEFPMANYMPDSNQSGKFEDMRETLPFVPYSLYEYKLNGETKYMYGDLRAIPGHEAQLYPLNQNSVVVRVDGYYFAAPNSLMAMLGSGDHRGENPYLEVQYYQKDEQPRKVRSVFLPVLSIKQAGPSWASLTSNSPFFKAESAPADHTLAKLLGLGAFFIGLYFVESSGAGDAWRSQQAECKRQQAVRPFVLC